MEWQDLVVKANSSITGKPRTKPTPPKWHERERTVKVVTSERGPDGRVRQRFHIAPTHSLRTSTQSLLTQISTK